MQIHKVLSELGTYSLDHQIKSGCQYMENPNSPWFWSTYLWIYVALNLLVYCVIAKGPGFARLDIPNLYEDLWSNILVLANISGRLAPHSFGILRWWFGVGPLYAQIWHYCFIDLSKVCKTNVCFCLGFGTVGCLVILVVDCTILIVCGLFFPMLIAQI